MEDGLLVFWKMVAAKQLPSRKKRPSHDILPVRECAVKPESRRGTGLSRGCRPVRSPERTPENRYRRGKNGRQHELAFVLAVCVVAALAGAKGFSEMARKARGLSRPLLMMLGAKWDWFKSRPKYPSKGTIRRVLCGIDASLLDRITGGWLAEHAARVDDDELAIAVDGKVLRGAWTDENDQVTLFSAMRQREGITIAQVRVPDGTNEITQVPALLEAMPVPAMPLTLLGISLATRPGRGGDRVTATPKAPVSSRSPEPRNAKSRTAE
jgi:hypothetical protein